MRRPARPALAVIGAGHLARAILPVLSRKGYARLIVASRDPAHAARAAREARGAVAATVPEAARLARWIVLAVPDRDIEPVARALALAVPGGWSGRAVLHTAGSRGAEALRPLAARGARCGVLHPLLSLGPGGKSARWPGARARIEGDRAAVAAARRLASDLGLTPLRMPPLTRAGRGAYHAAASVAANDLVALLDLAAEVLAGCGVARDEAERAIVALARSALERMASSGLGPGLTGPVVRGDAATLAAQLRSLARRLPAAARVHALLSERLLSLSVSSGRLPSDTVVALRAALRDGRSHSRRV